MTHTPGKWWLSKGPVGRESGIWTVGTHSPRAAHQRVYDICTLKKNPESEANARLIATAPELLEALEDAVTGLEWWVSTHPESASEADNEKLSQFNAAIKSARGQQ